MIESTPGFRRLADRPTVCLAPILQLIASRPAEHEVRGSTPMALVEFSPHLPRLFPQLAGGPIQVQASTVAEVLERLETLAPGVAFYICDERGRLRKHVNIFVAGEMIMDRQALTDELEPTTRVFVAQALSGG